MADPLDQDDLLAVVDRVLPDSYLDPLKTSGPGYEMVQGFAKIGERCSTAVHRFELDGYIDSAAAAVAATVVATFYRPTHDAGAITVLAGTIVRASQGGQVYKTIADAVFGGTDLTATAIAKAIGYGYEWNIKGPFVDPHGNTWPGELDTIDLPLTSPPFGDPSIAVRNDADSDDAGRPASLDVIGSERNLPRHHNEADPKYRTRIRTLPDTISPYAIQRQLTNYFRSFPLRWRAFETCEHTYQECFDAPEGGPEPFEPYADNLFVLDDPRPRSPMQNRLLGNNDYLGAFIVEVQMPPSIDDLGFTLDDPAADVADVTTIAGQRAFSAYDIPDTLESGRLASCLDGIDFGIDIFFTNLYNLLDEIKGGGVFVVIVIEEQG